MGYSGTTLDGIIVLDKAENWTSHDVVARTRSIVGTRHFSGPPAVRGILIRLIALWSRYDTQPTR